MVCHLLILAADKSLGTIAIMGTRMPTIDDIRSAAARLEGQANKTPVMTSRTLNERLGGEIHFKCENFQRMGAFKFRGAYNAVSRLSEAKRRRGVITTSSGNHAQAIALVGRIFDLKTVIVMPENAPAAKRAATEEYGGQIVPFDPEQTTYEAVAEALQGEHNYAFVPPFDHEHIIAGQGTAALELIDEVGALDQLLVPCGGGGLLSGCGIAAKALSPGCQVIGVEPELADDATRSFRTGKLHTVRNPQTIADGTRTASLGELTFPIIRRFVDEMATVSEEAIREAVRFLYYRMKLVVEPSGALGLAALLSGAVQSTGRVGVILSGGNMDGATLQQILQ